MVVLLKPFKSMIRQPLWAARLAAALGRPVDIELLLLQLGSESGDNTSLLACYQSSGIAMSVSECISLKH